MANAFIKLARAAAAVFLVAALATLAQAQRRPVTGASSNRAPDPQGELEREVTMRALEEQLHKPDNKRERRLAFVKISQDFTRIQIVNNDMLASAASSRNGPLDLVFMAKSAGEIRKLATRLKENLVLPEPEGNLKRAASEVAPADEKLKEALSTLGKLVASFAHNPIFKETNVVDAQLSAKARLDLENIIELSDNVRKACEKLGKEAQRAHTRPKD